MKDCIIGIDGGGTSCRAAIAGPDGRIIGRGRSGAANILTDPDTALANIINATSAAFADAGLEPALMQQAGAVLGLAGSNVGTVAAVLLDRLPFARATIESDGLIALQGALGNDDGGVAILGTGTVYLARHAGTVTTISGWGFIVGDLGSGARIGQAALQDSILAYDGIGPVSTLTVSTMARFSDDPKKMVEFARTAHPGDFARHAPDVFAFAAAGDRVALSILAAAALQIDAALDRLVSLGAGRLCLLGGLAEPYAPRLAARHRERLVGPAGDALTGAVALAASRFGPAPEVAA